MVDGVNHNLIFHVNVNSRLSESIMNILSAVQRRTTHRRTTWTILSQVGIDGGPRATLTFTGPAVTFLLIVNCSFLAGRVDTVSIIVECNEIGTIELNSTMKL